MLMGALSAIRSKYNTLSASQKSVADYVLENPEKVMVGTLSEVASDIGVSETTVIRFLHKLGFDSYQVFRVNIAQEISPDPTLDIYEEVTESDSPADVIQKVVGSTSQSILDSLGIISAEQLDRIVRSIRGARKIFLIGMGSSAVQAYDLNHKLLKLGLNSSYSHDPHLINIQAQTLDENDAMVIFSHSGESREILDGARYAKAGGCFIAGVTSYTQSTLASLADAVLFSSSKETSYRSDALTSRIIQLMIVDMIYIDLALSIGKPANETINKSRIAVAANKT